MSRTRFMPTYELRATDLEDKLILLLFRQADQAIQEEKQQCAHVFLTEIENHYKKQGVPIPEKYTPTFNTLKKQINCHFRVASLFASTEYVKTTINPQPQQSSPKPKI